ncbi:hypothetical protein PIB30_070322, partial [Stylosanthes scabra]|nr:hypothetical protein [Stylosanthes scabra]
MNDWAPPFIAAALFWLLSPGMIFQLPGKNSPFEFMNMKTTVASIFVHTSIELATSSKNTSLTTPALGAPPPTATMRRTFAAVLPLMAHEEASCSVPIWSNHTPAKGHGGYRRKSQDRYFPHHLPSRLKKPATPAGSCPFKKVVQLESLLLLRGTHVIML